MSDAEKQAWIAIPVVMLVGAGLAWAGSSGSVRFASLPVYAICIFIAFLIQWIVFVPSFINRTEKFFDLTGSITYLTVMAAAVLLSGRPDLRSVLLLVLVATWAFRLGTFLFRRIQKDGHDSRFDNLKTSFPRFLFTWTLQGLWVSFSAAAALGAVTSVNKADFGVWGIIGLIVWILGFGFEVVADSQKNQFRADPSNKGKFITTGLWSWSRHPNYFGEIVLWLGIAIMSLPNLSGWQYVTLISPIFVYLLLTRLSGVPMLEAKADDKWGGQADYEAYKANTSVLFPRPPSS
ncbi:MAG: DUF1295 domain-containing protein [Chloroflexota bacterium]